MSGDESKTDFSDIKKDDCTSRDFPGGAGADPSGELRVSIGRRAFDQISKHVAEDTDHEVCGVLLGDLCRDEKGPFLHITEIIEGAHAANQGAQVTITHDTWNHFHKIKDRDFPEKKYLGWYHSHPDFGIFLSAMDLFIHENFFNAPHQVALVVDPVRREEGLFFWQEGKPERADRFWVGGSEHKYEPAPEPSAVERTLADTGKKLDRLTTRLNDLIAFLQRAPESGFLQTVLMMGVLTLVGVQLVSGCRREEEQMRREAKDLLDIARRNIATLQYEPKNEVFIMRLELPPDRALMESPVFNADGTVTRVYQVPKRFFSAKYLAVVELVKIEEMKERIRKQEEEDRRRREEEAKKREKEREKEKGEEKDSGSGGGRQPETSPVGPKADSGPGAEGQVGK